jgi:GNAT superfamily N-acetyltransferase
MRIGRRAARPNKERARSIAARPSVWFVMPRGVAIHRSTGTTRIANNVFENGFRTNLFRLPGLRTADRPELLPVAALWLWEAFWRAGGHTLEHVEGVFARSVATVVPQQTFVLLDDGEPIGTASLVAHDLEARPELTPWLAGVFVVPHARQRGHATRLTQAVEDACRSAAIPTLWLYTLSAERLYARAGWVTVENFDRHGRPAALMRRDLSASS